ncbi:hypothetical protein CYOC110262_21985 [Cytobacillus oceanisediminis]|uniref:Uncharacterized protein n=1 Tax=Cytobacillus oceanisediminis TaxID=665099 RepID=A0A562JPI4_9BACI|nr:hypothetical protein IQ19_03316 [Cytobacillus oceanisediminis]
MQGFILIMKDQVLRKEAYLKKSENIKSRPIGPALLVNKKRVLRVTSVRASLIEPALFPSASV